MARSLLSSICALATAVVLTSATPASTQQVTPAAVQPAVPATVQPAAVATVQPAIPATPSAAPKQKAYPEVQAAFAKMLKTNDMPACIKDLQDAGRKYPELPSAHVLMYSLLSLPQVNQIDAARAQLEEAIISNPSDPEPHLIRGNIAIKERRYSEAATDFDKAKQLLAAYKNIERKGLIEQQTLSGMALVAEVHENWKEVESRLRDLLKIAPNDLAAHQRLAHSLFWQGNGAEAYSLLKKAKQIDRENAAKNGARQFFPAPEAIMAQYFETFEGPKSGSGNAEKWFRAALKNAPDDLATHRIVAIWALEKSKLDFAKEEAEAILRIEAADSENSDNNLGATLRGLVALWAKDWPVAETYFEKVVLDDPSNFAARNNLALALVEQNALAKKRRALAYAEANYRDYPKSPDALSTLGWVHFRRNEFDQAAVSLNQGLKAAGGSFKNADAVTYVAYVLHHQDKTWQAKAMLEIILKSDRPFCMRPEAQELYEKVKDATKPDAAPAANSP